MKHAFLMISVFCNALIVAHGFGGNTPVHLADKSQVAIEQLCHRIEKSRVHIASSNQRRNTVERKRTRLYGHSTSNCYLSLSFCDSCNDGDIVCTPSQPFYVIKSRRWVQACDLQIGDELRSKGGAKAAISGIVFVPEPIDVYAICVQDLHTFFVGKHAILTHNMALSALPFFVKLGCTLGSGGAAGSLLGPFGICFGISTAAMVFLAVHAVCGHGISYSMSPCDLDLLSARFEQDVDGFYTKAPCITVVPVDPSPPCIFVPAPLPEPNRGCGEVREPVLRAGGCGEIKMPTMDDLVLSYPASVPELPLIHAQEVEISGERAGSKAKPKVEEFAEAKDGAESLPVRELDFGHSAIQYDLLKKEYERLAKEARIEEFRSICNLTEHGLERLMERFTSDELRLVLHDPDLFRIQENGLLVYIKQIGDNYNVIVLNPITRKLVTALDGIDKRALANLGENYGWKL
mgnify:CR=1 FL=1